MPLKLWISITAWSQWVISSHHIPNTRIFSVCYENNYSIVFSDHMRKKIKLGQWNRLQCMACQYTYAQFCYKFNYFQLGTSLCTKPARADTRLTHTHTHTQTHPRQKVREKTFGWFDSVEKIGPRDSLPKRTLRLQKSGSAFLEKATHPRKLIKLTTNLFFCVHIKVWVYIEMIYIRFFEHQYIQMQVHVHVSACVSEQGLGLIVAYICIKFQYLEYYLFKFCSCSLI